MERDTLVQLFDQILNGMDIPTPTGLLRIRKETVSTTNAHLPYPLVTNLAHTVMWQNLWLDKLEGKPKKPSMEVWKNDWRLADSEEWDDLRKQFVSGLNRARTLAAEGPLDAERIETLLRIAVHGAYHMGQLNLLKRSLRLGHTEGDAGS